MRDEDDPLARWLTGAGPVEDSTLGTPDVHDTPDIHDTPGTPDVHDVHDVHDVQGAAPDDRQGPAAASGPDPRDLTSPPPTAPDLADEPAAPSRRLVVGAAIGVWLALGVLLVVRATAGAAGDGPDPVTGDAHSPGDAAVASDQDGEPEAPGGDVVGGSGADPADSGAEPAAGAAHADSDADDAELAAAATTALRLALVGADPGAGDEAVRYVDHAVAESVERHGEAAVVVVRVVFLHGSGADWDRSRPARWAVPLRILDGRAVPAGAPWPLAPPTTSPRSFGWTEVDDVELVGDVRALLDAAGWTLADGVELSVADGLDGIVRAEVTGRAPGELGDAPHEVWFVADGDQLRVAGERHDATQANPHPDPDPDPSLSPNPSASR